MAFKVLIACEVSQIICSEFRNLGVEAYSCDLLPTSGLYPQWHILGDAVREAYSGQYSFMIAHPPCQYLSNAGNRYLNSKIYGSQAFDRHYRRFLAASFFMQLYNAPIQHIAIENPVGFINPIIKPSQIINPYYFGEAEKKRTCLWLKNLPALFHTAVNTLFEPSTHVPVEPVYISKNGKQHFFTESITGHIHNSSSLRSRSFKSIAKAMAFQWSTYLNLL